MITRRHGVRAFAFPDWKVAGCADHVARESSLSAADAVTLHRDGKESSALAHYDRRRRVERAPAQGATVDLVFVGQ